MISDSNKRILFYAFTILSFLAAIYHLIGIFYKINNSPVWRHVIFVVVNLFCIYGFLKRPKYFIYFFCVLTLQQYNSHGSHLIRLYTLEHKIHWISLFVIILLPIGLFCLFEDKRSNRINDLKNKDTEKKN
jgi:hypothetical protein